MKVIDVPIEKIHLGDRYRRDMGNIEPAALGLCGMDAIQRFPGFNEGLSACRTRAAAGGVRVSKTCELVFDAARHRYYLHGVCLPNVTRVLESAGLLNYDFLGERREFYLARGQAVHRATGDDDEGNLAEGSVSPAIRGYVEAWRAFRRDYGFQPQLIEHRVYNLRHGYAGCIDRTGRTRDGAKVILDLKTGTAPAATRYQLVAYLACLPRPRAFRRRCVELHGDASYRVIAYETRDYLSDLNEFLAALETYRTREEK
jgi:hypothetical protein